MLRTYKRFLIVALTLLVLGTPVLFFALKGIVSPESTCVDNIKNQDEEGIDCGGSCPFPCRVIPKIDDVKTLRSFVVPAGNGLYDVIFDIKNPHSELGIPDLTYTVVLQDSGGEEIRKLTGKSFLLPGETAFVIIPAVRLDRVPATVNPIFHDALWVKPRIDPPALEVLNSTFRALPAGNTFSSEATGIVKNNSPYGFNAVVISILLFDNQGGIMGSITSEVNTLKSREARFFQVSWPEPFTRSVGEVRMIPRVNIMDEQNILRPPPQEEFQ